ncbi:MAG: hypothetical protein AB1568_13510 [Thermodesulfobacteriota bacterium]
MTLGKHAYFVLVFLLSGVVSAYAAGDSAASGSVDAPVAPYTVQAVETSRGAEGYEVRIKGDSVPTYTMHEMIDPLRVVVDIAQARLAKTSGLPRDFAEGPVARLAGTAMGGEEIKGVRLEIFLAEDREYTVERGGNDIVLRLAGMKMGGGALPAAARKLVGIDVQKGDAATTVTLMADGPVENFKYADLPASDGHPPRMYLDLPDLAMEGVETPVAVGTMLKRIRSARKGGGTRLVFDSAREQLFAYEVTRGDKGIVVRITEPSPVAAVLAGIMGKGGDGGVEKPAKAAAAEPAATAAGSGDNFALTSYQGQRITVDFYKIDLHNVFRLMGDISGKNIVIDEGVGGSLTLALDNVPWDFVLDIIMNLKDLQKEERFDTIVISSKAKGFSWPQQAADEIAFKADPIVVNQRIETSPEVVAGKQLLSRAQGLEASGDIKGAMAAYEEAFLKWPDNSAIAKQLAMFYLTRENLNAKAAHYAKQAVKLDINDQEAALLAALSLANMKKDAEAKEYFDLAVAGNRPGGDALINYAAFQEKGGNYAAALSLLARHEALYGDNLDTFIGKARIHDKIGESKQALKEYEAALLSGYDMPDDLKQYIKGRVAAANLDSPASSPQQGHSAKGFQ